VKRKFENEVSRLEKMGSKELGRFERSLAVHLLCLEHPIGLFKAKSDCNFVLNEDPLSIYLHQGGHRAVYFDLRGNEDRSALKYIEVQVLQSFQACTAFVEHAYQCLTGCTHTRFTLSTLDSKVRTAFANLRRGVAI